MRDIFRNGSTWLRADFLLYDEVGSPEEYVDSLQKAGITIGVAVRPGGFDVVRFRQLRERAFERGIFLLPGVELLLNEGENGVRAVSVFGDEWIRGSDYVSSFLTAAGKNSESENARSPIRLTEGFFDTVELLEEYRRDFFLFFPEVEASQGLWHEMDDEAFIRLVRHDLFRRRVLAFQGVRTHEGAARCRLSVRELMGNHYPAEVEAALAGECFLKVGAFTFEAVHYALSEYAGRVDRKPRVHEASSLESVSFEGGMLDGVTLDFSPELNVLIGIRGSGKSAILELLRYALDIPFEEMSSDREYKTRLVEFVLGSGGRVSIHARDRRGTRYEIRRIFKEVPDVYVDGVRQSGISVLEDILHKPLYFGQKDLSNTGEGFERSLVEKMLGNKTDDIRRRIEEQKQKVAALAETAGKLSDVAERKREHEAQRKDAAERLKFYQDYGLEEKLQKQVDFDTDARTCAQVTDAAKAYLGELETFIRRCGHELQKYRGYVSPRNAPFFKTFFDLYERLCSEFKDIKTAFSESGELFTRLDEQARGFVAIQEQFKEEFAVLERKVAMDLQVRGIRAIRLDEFRSLRQLVDSSQEALESLDRQENEHRALLVTLDAELENLEALRREEFATINALLQEVNAGNSRLKIHATFGADRAAFVDYMKEFFRENGLSDSMFRSITETFPNFALMYKNLDAAAALAGSAGATFKQQFMESLSGLLTWQVPHLFAVEYRGRALKQHSLGQRASALILFVLSREENDVIIVDQPEDDLDNQTIYEDVIKLLCSLKPRKQFIFATHNANIPVLGDAEQVLVSACRGDVIRIGAGSIDSPAVQQSIVDIMEGGEEAFIKRKGIYEIWKPRNERESA